MNYFNKSIKSTAGIELIFEPPPLLSNVSSPKVKIPSCAHMTSHLSGTFVIQINTWYSVLAVQELNVPFKDVVQHDALEGIYARDAFCNVYLWLALSKSSNSCILQCCHLALPLSLLLLE